MFYCTWKIYLISTCSNVFFVTACIAIPKANICRSSLGAGILKTPWFWRCDRIWNHYPQRRHLESLRRGALLTCGIESFCSRRSFEHSWCGGVAISQPLGHHLVSSTHSTHTQHTTHNTQFMYVKRFWHKMGIFFFQATIIHVKSGPCSMQPRPPRQS
jgi:hypothetical protein